MFVGLLATQFDKIILSNIASLESVGVYSIAQRIAIAIGMLMNALGRVYQPKLYKVLFDLGFNKTAEFIAFYMFVSFVPALFVILFAQEIFLIFPEGYAWGYKILVVLSCYHAFLYVCKINGPQLLFAKKTWLISGLSLASAIFNIVITYPLVLAYGAVGAAAGTAFSTLIISIVNFYFAQKFAAIKWNYYIIFLDYLFILFSAFFILFIDNLISSYLIVLAMKILILFLFGLLAYFQGIFNVQNFAKN